MNLSLNELKELQEINLFLKQIIDICQTNISMLDSDLISNALMNTLKRVEVLINHIQNERDKK